MKKFDLKELCAFALKKYNLRSDLLLVVTYISPSSEQTSSLLFSFTYLRQTFFN